MAFIFPSSDESHQRLKAGGWSLGYVGYGPTHGRVWQVSGTNGENRIEAFGRTLEEA